MQIKQILVKYIQNNATKINNMYIIIHIMDNTTKAPLEKDALVKVQQLQPHLQL